MLYEIKNLLKTRQREKGYRLLIRSLRIPRGARIALLGPSGCGKSTTLDILGLSLAPDDADIFRLVPPGREAILPFVLWQRHKLDKLANLRLQYMGYVLQTGELLPFLSVGQNICLPSSLIGMPAREAQKSGQDLAKRLQILDLWSAMPGTLSVGERQRAAIVRALTPRPAVILADEPTAALDPNAAKTVMTIFLECLEEFGSALILATHNAEWAATGGLSEIRFSFEREGDTTTAIIDDAG